MLEEVNDLLYLDHNDSDQVFATLPDPTPSDPMFEPISIEELTTAQLNDAFCVQIRRRLNEGVLLPFGENDDGVLCRKVSHEQIFIPHAEAASPPHPPLFKTGRTSRWKKIIPVNPKGYVLACPRS